MKIAIVHNRVSGESTPDEEDVLKQAEAVLASLERLGHEPFRIECDLDLDSLRSDLKDTMPDLVFNLVESLGGHGRLLNVVPALLEAMEIPYTGSSSEALYHTTHKLMAKERLRAVGLPTPDWINSYPEDMPWAGSLSHSHARSSGSLASDRAGSLRRRWIVKSLWEHASFGIDESSVVEGDIEDAGRIVRERSSSLGGASFAEEFIDGREFNISLLGERRDVVVLPPAEILFRGEETGAPRIVGYRAKWVEDAKEYLDTPRSFEFGIEDFELLESLREISIACWRIFNLRGYARVDFRVDSSMNPLILEVNANPCISPDAGFAAALERGGISYDDAIKRIIAASTVVAKI